MSNGEDSKSDKYARLLLDLRSPSMATRAADRAAMIDAAACIEELQSELAKKYALSRDVREAIVRYTASFSAILPNFSDQQRINAALLDIAQIALHSSVSAERDSVIEECAKAVIGARVLWDDDLPAFGEQVADALVQVAQQVRRLKASPSSEQRRFKSVDDLGPCECGAVSESGCSPESRRDDCPMAASSSTMPLDQDFVRGLLKDLDEVARRIDYVGDFHATKNGPFHCDLRKAISKIRMWTAAATTIRNAAVSHEGTLPWGREGIDSELNACCYRHVCRAMKQELAARFNDTKRLDWLSHQSGINTSVFGEQNCNGNKSLREMIDNELARIAPVSAKLTNDKETS